MTIEEIAEWAAAHQAVVEIAIAPNCATPILFKIRQRIIIGIGATLEDAFDDLQTEKKRAEQYREFMRQHGS